MGKIAIACPNCGKFVIKADKDDKRPNRASCSGCGKVVKYIASTGYRKAVDKPERPSSSGCIFY